MPDMASTPELRALTAHHEAGHAVASAMRGGSVLRSVDFTRAETGHGETYYRSKPTDGGFIAYAGPWAEARFLWPDAVPLDGEDDDGLRFEDYVAGVLLTQPSDADAVYAHFTELRQLTGEQGVEAATEAVWHRELVRVWPAIREAATRLLGGEALTDTVVRAAVSRCLP